MVGHDMENDKSDPTISTDNLSADYFSGAVPSKFLDLGRFDRVFACDLSAKASQG